MVFQKTADILAEYKGLEASDITPETTLEQLELDSLDRVELIMSLEDAFEVQLDAAVPVQCVNDLVAAIEGQLAGAAQ